MMSLREQFVKQQTALKNLRKGMEQITIKGQPDASIMALDETLSHLEFQINRIEKAMDALIKTYDHCSFRSTGVYLIRVNVFIGIR